VSAQDLAAEVQPGSVVRWDRIERAAFAAHPSILRSDAGRRVARVGFGNSLWNLIWAVPAIILYLFCYTTPVWGAAAISVSRFQNYQQDPEQRIPLSGVMFSFALLLLVVSFVRWLAAGRRPSGVYEIQAVLALVLGVLSAIAVRMYGLRDSVESWQTWILPILGATIAGAVFLIFLVAARVSRGSRRQAGSVRREESLSASQVEVVNQRRLRIQQLSEAERIDVRSDLDAAVNDLLERGLVSEAEAHRAREAELGALALTMGQKK